MPPLSCGIMHYSADQRFRRSRREHPEVAWWLHPGAPAPEKARWSLATSLKLSRAVGGCFSLCGRSPSGAPVSPGMATPLVSGDGDAKLKNRLFAKPDNIEQPTTSQAMPQKVLSLRNGQKAQKLYGLPLCFILRSKVPEHGLEGSPQDVPCHQFSVDASERCLRINKRAAKMPAQGEALAAPGLCN